MRLDIYLKKYFLISALLVPKFHRENIILYGDLNSIFLSI